MLKYSAINERVRWFREFIGKKLFCTHNGYLSSVLLKLKSIALIKKLKTRITFIHNCLGDIIYIFTPKYS